MLSSSELAGGPYMLVGPSSTALSPFPPWTAATLWHLGTRPWRYNIVGSGEMRLPWTACPKPRWTLICPRVKGGLSSFHSPIVATLEELGKKPLFSPPQGISGCALVFCVPVSKKGTKDPGCPDDAGMSSFWLHPAPVLKPITETVVANGALPPKPIPSPPHRIVLSPKYVAAGMPVLPIGGWDGKTPLNQHQWLI